MHSLSACFQDSIHTAHIHTHAHTPTHTHWQNHPRKTHKWKHWYIFCFQGLWFQFGSLGFTAWGAIEETKSQNPSHQNDPTFCCVCTAVTSLFPLAWHKSVCVCMCIVQQAIMVIKATIIKVLFAELYVNVVFVIRCFYSAVSLTLIKELRFVRIIYYYYYKSLTM